MPVEELIVPLAQGGSIHTFSQDYDWPDLDELKGRAAIRCRPNRERPEGCRKRPCCNAAGGRGTARRARDGAGSTTRYSGSSPTSDSAMKETTGNASTSAA